MSVEKLISQFEVQQVLRSDPQAKQLVLLGQISGENAIVSLERSHFVVGANSVSVSDIVAQVELINSNDVYYWAGALTADALPEKPSAKVNVIYPATETHIRKFRQQRYHYILETPEIYQKFVAPYIETMKGDRIKWVYNILFEGKESETFVHHDKDPQTGFVLLPDMKWDRVNMDALYLCCIVNRKDIASVRDITGDHYEFLFNLKSRVLNVTNEQFNIPKDQLRVFIHYQPSYYHFHVHVVNVLHPGLGGGFNVGKAILLDDVLDNIKMVPDYYQRKTIGYVVGENHGLWEIEGFRNAVSN